MLDHAIRSVTLLRFGGLLLLLSMKDVILKLHSARLEMVGVQLPTTLDGSNAVALTRKLNFHKRRRPLPPFPSDLQLLPAQRRPKQGNRASTQ